MVAKGHQGVFGRLLRDMKEQLMRDLEERSSKQTEELVHKYRGGK